MGDDDDFLFDHRQGSAVSGKDVHSEVHAFVDVAVSDGEIVAALVNTLFKLGGGAITVPADDFRAEVLALKSGKRMALRPMDGPENTIVFRAVRRDRLN